MCEAADSTLQIDNSDVRVTEWRLAPGTATGHHRHEYDYVVVPMTNGQLTAVTPSGRAIAELRPGQPYFRKAGVEHDILNETKSEIVFIEIELKDSASS